MKEKSDPVNFICEPFACDFGCASDDYYQTRITAISPGNFMHSHYLGTCTIPIADTG